MKVRPGGIGADELGETPVRTGFVDLVEVVGAAIAAGIAVDVRRDSAAIPNIAIERSPGAPIQGSISLPEEPGELR